MKILHVSASYNAGVLQGIEYIVARYPQHEHSLLWASHFDSPSPSPEYLQSTFSHAWFWKGGFIGKYVRLIKIISSTDANVIHLHSSIAGALGRLIPSTIPKIYSPHCFAFQRTDVPRPIRFFLLGMEKILSLRKFDFALCWPIEIEIAKKYFKKTKINFTPIVDYSELRSSKLININAPSMIACIGRIRPQKDPRYLIQAATAESSMNEDLIWIGSGDEDLSEALQRSGIRVISWMKQEDIWNPEMSIGATCITSSWESGPLTLFESLRAGRPVICRSIEAIDLYGFPTYDTTIGFAKALKMVNQSLDFRSLLFESQVSLIVKKFEDLTKTYSFSDHYFPHGSRNA